MALILDHTVAKCPRCGHAMQFVRSVPKLGALPELLVFVCPACGDAETMEDARRGEAALAR